jgi:glycosyltransferase involved in cell wall biosynthesis
VTDSPLVVHLVLSLRPGGLERLVCNLAAAPALRSFRVLVCCLDEEGDLAADVRRAGHRVEVVRRRGGLDAGLVFRLARYLREQRADVVHTHSLDPMFYGGLAAWLAGVPVRVHTQHNTQVFTTYGVRDRFKFRLAARLFSSVVAVGAETDRELARAGVSAARRVVIRNGIDVGRYATGAAAGSAVLGSPPGPRVVGTVARLSREKGIDLLVDAFARLVPGDPATRLVIVGEGPERGALEALARSCGVSDRVTFQGFHPRVAELLPGFDVFVLPSRTEGLPLALLEAMAAGRACVATKVGGVPEVVADGVTGVLVAPGDPAALAAAVQALLADPVLRRRLGTAARAQVEGAWSEDAMARSYAVRYRVEAPPAAWRRLVKGVLHGVPRRWIAWRGAARRPEIAFTFDDGPDPEWTPRLLDTLRAHGVRSTFFLVGERAERHPALVHRIVEEGHELGNHSFSHPQFERLSWRDAMGEIDRTEAVLAGASRTPPRLWRPPRGKLCLASILGARLRHLTLVMWNVDLKDFSARAPEDIVDRLAARPLRAGDIVLYHGQNAAALAALPRLLETAAAARLGAVPVSQLLAG